MQGTKSSSMIDTVNFRGLREEMEHFDAQRETVIKRSRGTSCILQPAL